jgi:hypothetical protein
MQLGRSSYRPVFALVHHPDLLGGAAKNIAAIPAESITFIGVAVLIADTGYELYAGCWGLLPFSTVESCPFVHDSSKGSYPLQSGHSQASIFIAHQVANVP